MKIRLIFLFLFCTQIVLAESRMIDQLAEVNPFWKLETFNPMLANVEALPTPSQKSLIQLHLALVENELRQRDVSNLSAHQKTNRIAALDILQQYWQAGIFPINNYHDYRIPYFVDDANTACAVGHLIREGGNLEVVNDVVSTMNNSYIAEIRDERLNKWALENGFLISELQWIQPSYPPLEVNINVTESSCEEANGSATVEVLPSFFYYNPETWDADRLQYRWFQNNAVLDNQESSTLNQFPAGRYEFQSYILKHNWVMERSVLISDEDTNTPEVLITEESASEANDGSVSATMPDQGEYQYEWFSYDGQLLSDGSILNGIHFSAYSQFYIPYQVFLKVTNEDGCQNWSQHSVVYDLPCPIAFAQVKDGEEVAWGIKKASCGESDGAIYPRIYGEVDSLLWSNGSSNQDLTDVSAGNYTLTVFGEGGCNNSTAFYLPEECTGANGIQDENSMSQSYPNPASDFLNIESSSLIKNVRLIQMNGQIALERSVNSSSSIHLQTAGLPSGLYILTVESEKGISQEKVLLN